MPDVQETEPRLPGPVRLGALLACELAIVIVLHQLGRYEWMRVDWSDLSRWLEDTPPEDALVAAARVIALVAAWWMLASTAAYTAAAFARAPRALRSVGWATLPALRRVVDGIVALSITGGTVAGTVPSPPVGAATHVAPDVDRDLVSVYRLPATAGMKIAVYRSTSPLPEPSPGTATHTVEAGECLWDIAEQALGDGTRWPEIWDANRDRLAAAGHGDPNVLLVGWVLELPSASASPPGDEGSPPAADHTVQPGDTLTQIAADRLGDPGRVDEIVALNLGRPQSDGDALADPDLIRPGWSLALPPGADGDPAPDGRSSPPGEGLGAEAEEPSDTDAPPVSGPADVGESSSDTTDSPAVPKPPASGDAQGGRSSP